MRFQSRKLYSAGHVAVFYTNRQYTEKGVTTVVVTLKHSLLVTLLAFSTMAHAEVNFVSWGGAYAQSQQKAYVDTYDGDQINFMGYCGRSAMNSADKRTTPSTDHAHAYFIVAHVYDS